MVRSEAGMGVGECWVAGGGGHWEKGLKGEVRCPGKLVLRM